MRRLDIDPGGVVNEEARRSCASSLITGDAKVHCGPTDAMRRRRYNPRKEQARTREQAQK
jgi:hypothetical protein